MVVECVSPPQEVGRHIPQVATPIRTRLDHQGRCALPSTAVTLFREQGFLSMTHIARVSEIAQVQRIIDGLYTQQGREYGFLQNPSALAPELRNSPIYTSCQAIAQQLLGRHTWSSCDLALYKEPHGRFGTPWHQDAAFHSKYSPNNTIIFWIPLQDVTPDNGCMHFIPMRPDQALLPHRPFYPNDNSSMTTDQVEPGEAIACPLRMGEATIHGPLTPHMAPPNSTSFARRTWTITFSPWGKWGFLTPARLSQRARLLRDRLREGAR
jgi:hypothetical protein